MAVVCNLIRMGRWSEIMVVCVCHSDEVMREAVANDTSGELDHRCLLSVCCFFVCFCILCLWISACNCYASCPLVRCACLPSV